MDLKNFKIAREIVPIFHQIIKLTKKISSNLSNINICLYIKTQIPVMHRKLFQQISQNKDVENFVLIEIFLFIFLAENGFQTINHSKIVYNFKTSRLNEFII